MIGSGVTSASVRHSGRSQLIGSKKVIDDASRKRRLNKQIETLEQDNFHEDPHAHLRWHKNIPKFDDENVLDSQSRKKRKIRAEHSKQRFRKNFMALLEAETASRTVEGSGVEAYNNTRALPSLKPARNFCSVCGFFSKYNCTTCGSRYCSIVCRDLHVDTRCLKWTV